MTPPDIHGSLSLWPRKSIYLVQAFAGHSDPRITDRYVHLAADKLKQLFDEPAKIIDFPAGRGDRKNQE